MQLADKKEACFSQKPSLLLLKSKFSSWKKHACFLPRGARHFKNGARRLGKRCLPFRRERKKSSRILFCVITKSSKSLHEKFRNSSRILFLLFMKILRRCFDELIAASPQPDCCRIQTTVSELTNYKLFAKSVLRFLFYCLVESCGNQFPGALGNGISWQQCVSFILGTK